jgi:hypothetical protein
MSFLFLCTTTTVGHLFISRRDIIIIPSSSAFSVSPNPYPWPAIRWKHDMSLGTQQWPARPKWTKALADVLHLPRTTKWPRASNETQPRMGHCATAHAATIATSLSSNAMVHRPPWVPACKGQDGVVGLLIHGLLRAWCSSSIAALVLHVQF